MLALKHSNIPGHFGQHCPGCGGSGFTQSGAAQSTVEQSRAQMGHPHGSGFGTTFRQSAGKTQGLRGQIGTLLFTATASIKRAHHNHQLARYFILHIYNHKNTQYANTYPDCSPPPTLPPTHTQKPTWSATFSPLLLSITIKLTWIGMSLALQHCHCNNECHSYVQTAHLTAWGKRQLQVAPKVHLLSQEKFICLLTVKWFMQQL